MVFGLLPKEQLGMKDQNIVNMSSQVTEPTIKAMFQTIWTGLGEALAAMPSWEKGFIFSGFSALLYF